MPPVDIIFAVMFGLTTAGVAGFLGYGVWKLIQIKDPVVESADSANT